MKKSRFTDAQVLAILKQSEGGAAVADLCRDHGISNATCYNWRSKFGGMPSQWLFKNAGFLDFRGITVVSNP